MRCYLAISIPVLGAAGELRPAAGTRHDYSQLISQTLSDTPASRYRNVDIFFHRYPPDVTAGYNGACLNVKSANESDSTRGCRNGFKNSF